jgi:hypothetical protein
MPKRKLEDYQVDLVILWVDQEKMTYPKCIERLVSMFGEDVRVTVNGLMNRVHQRREFYNSGMVAGNNLLSMDKLDDKSLLDWIQAAMYRYTYSSVAADNVPEIRRNVDTLLKVIKMKRDIAGSSDEDAEKEAQEFLEKIRSFDKASLN